MCYRAATHQGRLHQCNSLRLNDHFPGEPGGEPVFIEAQDDGGGGDNWTTVLEL